jgi:hypothetical protein
MILVAHASLPYAVWKLPSTEEDAVLERAGHRDRPLVRSRRVAGGPDDEDPTSVGAGDLDLLQRPRRERRADHRPERDVESEP